VSDNLIQERIIISTVGISATFSKLIEDQEGFKLKLNDASGGESAIEVVVQALREKTHLFSELKAKIAPAEVSSLLAIGVNKFSDKLYFVGGSSTTIKIDPGEVCREALTRYFRLQGYTAKSIEVSGAIVDLLDGSMNNHEETLRVLDNFILEIRRKNKEVPIIINATGGFRIAGIYAAVLGLVHKCEIYYLHETMTEPVGLPALSSDILNLKESIGEIEYKELNLTQQKAYKLEGGKYYRLSLLDIISRMPRNWQETENIQPQQAEKLKILFLAANPRTTSRLAIDTEYREISDTLLKATLRDRFELKNEGAVRYEDFNYRLLSEKPRYLHFSGHGSEEGELCLDDGVGKTQKIPLETLEALFKILSNQVECVLLNACYSQTQAPVIAQHIKYVIGMQTAINDKAALEFAKGFYQALGEGRSMEEAFELGCGRIQTFLPTSAAHLIPSFYREGVRIK
jgi:CRISPR-associated protein (Cas_APE2256)/CHAT domain